jgi:peptide/nickel transport system ATP-binding protein
MALALEPKLLILDEPTTALDVVVQHEILAELDDLRARLGFAVLFISHDLDLMVQVATRIAVLYGGKIVEEASAAELVASPRHPYTRGLLASAPSLTGPRRTLTGVRGSPPDLREPPSGCRFHPRCDLAIPACRVTVPLPRAIAASGSVTRARSVACHLEE